MPRRMPARVEVWKDGQCVALHERCYGRQKQVLELEHYLDVLSRKPGALAGSRPLEQQRRAGHWPESFDAMWQALNARHGKQDGTRQMIDLLKLAKPNGRPAESGDRDSAGAWLHGRRRGAASLSCAGPGPYAL
jgi:hypothetical protein